MTDLLATTLAQVQDVILRSDEHRAYSPAVRRIPCTVKHEITSSKKPRTTRNPLFAVNELDLLIRHSQANHKRETIAFSKRRQASAERLTVLLVWRNYVKSRSEKKPGTTPAMLRGRTDRPWSVAAILGERLFPDRIDLPRRWAQYYRRDIQTRELRRNRSHHLRYAF